MPCEPPLDGLREGCISCTPPARYLCTSMHLLPLLPSHWGGMVGSLAFSPALWVTGKMTPTACRMHSHLMGWPKPWQPCSQGGEWAVSVAHLYRPHHAGASPQSRSRWQLSFAVDYSLAASVASLPRPPGGSGAGHAAQGQAPTASSSQTGAAARASWTRAQLTNSSFQNSSTVRAPCHPHRHKPGLGESSLAWAKSHRLRLHKVRLRR